MNNNEIRTFTNLTSFNDALSNLSATIAVKWEGRQVSELKSNLDVAQEMIQNNQSLLNGRENPETIRFIKTAKQLSEVMKSAGADNQSLATSIKTSAFSLESIESIHQLKDIDNTLYLQTLAYKVNTNDVSSAITLKSLDLSKESSWNSHPS